MHADYHESVMYYADDKWTKIIISWLTVILNYLELFQLFLLFLLYTWHWQVREFNVNGEDEIMEMTKTPDTVKHARKRSAAFNISLSICNFSLF